MSTSNGGAPIDTVTLTIDGKEVTVPKGTLLIRAAEQLGTIIPRFCDHPLLDPVGACRQCIVEVEGQRKPMTACTTEAADGWVVNTQHTSEVADTAQAAQLEFLLINHPLDCPMCDKGGECPLQDQAMAHGRHESRFVDEKRKYDKPVAVSAQVLLDRERCVLCARCTRFSDQVAGDPFIELFERGALEQVAIYEDEPYESYFSGNVIQICPVGALTSTSYRFKARPFDLRSMPGVCDGCSAGCSLTVQSRRGQVERQLARTNMPVNEMWNCDKGRFGYGHLTADTRLTTPFVRDPDAAADHDGLVEADWARALTTVMDILAPDGPGGEVVPTAVLSGGRLPDEDAYVAGKFARTVLGTDDVDFRTRFAPASEADALAALAGRDTATYDDVEHAGVVLTVGLDPEEEVPILYLRLRKAWRANKARLVGIGSSTGSLSELLWRRLPSSVGGEADVLAALAAAVEGGDREGHLGEVATALGEVDTPVVLVGERAGDGALAAAGRLADAIGGKVAWVPRRSNARGALDNGLAAGRLPGGRRLDDDAQRAEVAAAWGVDLPDHGRDLAEVLREAGKGRIKVLYLLGVDLVRDVADQRLVAKALRKATVITHDIVRNATTPHADVVLPVSASQERAGTRTNWEGRSQRFQQGVAGPQLVQHDWEILVQLAGLLGHDLGFVDLEGLRADAAALAPVTDARPWPDPAGHDDGDDASDESGDDLALETYPYLLDRGVHQVNAPDLAATARTATARLHPSDAVAREVTDGDVVTVAGGAGEVTLPVSVTPDQARGTIFVPANSLPRGSGSDADDANPRHLGDRVAVTRVAAPDDAETAAQEVPA